MIKAVWFRGTLGECLFRSQNCGHDRYRKEEAQRPKKPMSNYTLTERHQKAETTAKEQNPLITPNLIHKWVSQIHWCCIAVWMGRQFILNFIQIFSKKWNSLKILSFGAFWPFSLFWLEHSFSFGRAAMRPCGNFSAKNSCGMAVFTTK